MTNGSTAPTPSRDPFLDELFEKIPQAELARRLTADNGEGKTVTRMAVNQWKRVPDHWVRLVASYTGFPLKKVRADLYDPHYRKPGAVGTAAIA